MQTRLPALIKSCIGCKSNQEMFSAISQTISFIASNHTTVDYSILRELVISNFSLDNEEDNCDLQDDPMQQLGSFVAFNCLLKGVIQRGVKIHDPAADDELIPDGLFEQALEIFQHHLKSGDVNLIRLLSQKVLVVFQTSFEVFQFYQTKYPANFFFVEYCVFYTHFIGLKRTFKVLGKKLCHPELWKSFEGYALQFNRFILKLNIKTIENTEDVVKAVLFSVGEKGSSKESIDLGFSVLLHIFKQCPFDSRELHSKNLSVVIRKCLKNVQKIMEKSFPILFQNGGIRARKEIEQITNYLGGFRSICAGLGSHFNKHFWEFSHKGEHLEYFTELVVIVESFSIRGIVMCESIMMSNSEKNILNNLILVEHDFINMSEFLKQFFCDSLVVVKDSAKMVLVVKKLIELLDFREAVVMVCSSIIACYRRNQSKEWFESGMKLLNEVVFQGVPFVKQHFFLLPLKSCEIYPCLFDRLAENILLFVDSLFTSSQYKAVKGILLLSITMYCDIGSNDLCQRFGKLIWLHLVRKSVASLDILFDTIIPSVGKNLFGKQTSIKLSKYFEFQLDQVSDLLENELLLIRIDFKYLLKQLNGIVMGNSKNGNGLENCKILAVFPRRFLEKLLLCNGNNEKFSNFLVDSSIFSMNSISMLCKQKEVNTRLVFCFLRLISNVFFVKSSDSVNPLCSNFLKNDIVFTIFVEFIAMSLKYFSSMEINQLVSLFQRNCLTCFIQILSSLFEHHTIIKSGWITNSQIKDFFSLIDKLSNFNFMKIIIVGFIANSYKFPFYDDFRNHIQGILRKIMCIGNYEQTCTNQLLCRLVMIEIYDTLEVLSKNDSAMVSEIASKVDPKTREALVNVISQKKQQKEIIEMFEPIPENNMMCIFEEKMKESGTKKRKRGNEISELLKGRKRMKTSMSEGIEVFDDKSMVLLTELKGNIDGTLALLKKCVSNKTNFEKNDVEELCRKSNQITNLLNQLVEKK